MRQYIGARYVPTIADPFTWDNSHSYEALVMVDYMGDTYTSKKPVPAGIAISNTDYWVQTGSFNSQLNLISGRVSDLEDVVKDDRWVVVTDSYGTTYANDPGDNNTLYDYMRTALGRTSDNLIAQAYGGRGFIKSYDGENFLQSFTTFTNGISSDVKKEITKIVVAAGRNDYESSENDIVAAIGSFVSYCKTEYPNAIVYTMFIANGNGIWNGTKAEIQNVYNAYVRSGEVGATYITGGEAILKQQASMASDGVHPSSLGKKYLGRYMAEGIVNGFVNVYYPKISVALASNDKETFVDLASIPLDTTIAGNNITITPPKLTAISVNTPFTPDTTTDICLGSYVANRNFYTFLEDVYLPVRLDIKDGNGNYITDTSASLRLTTDCKLKMRIYQNPSAHTIGSIIVMANGSAMVPVAIA